MAGGDEIDGILSDLVGRHREELREKAKVSRWILVAAIAMTLYCFSVFLFTLGGNYPLPWAESWFAGNPERLLGITNFFMMTAIGSSLRIWRTRQMRIKTLIAEAFIREEDDDTALRLLLEPVFGDTVWDKAHASLARPNAGQSERLAT